VAPQLLADQNVLIVAHGNSLRALLMHLEGVSRDDIAELNIPTGAPRRYRFDAGLRVTDAAYLGDQQAIAAAAAQVAAQSKA
jgi:2,3-bisphosphoglycerate-dependent phosphoglycerate mutase